MAYNNQLTQKEKAYLEDALQMENLCITKCNVYADHCQDGNLKDMIFSMSKNKRQHANRIKQVLSSGSINYSNQYNSTQYQ